MSDLHQSRIADTPTSDPRGTNTPDSDTVYVVVYRRMDDPHPHCEGVYMTEPKAEDAMRRCESTWEEPKDAVAWELEQMEVDD